MRVSTILKRGLAGASLGIFGLGIAHAEYKGAPRTFLYNPAIDVCIKDTSAFKKDPPYVIGFSNAGLGDSWRVVGLHSLEKAAAEHKDVVKQLHHHGRRPRRRQADRRHPGLGLPRRRSADRQREHGRGARPGRLRRRQKPASLSSWWTAASARTTS